MPKKKTVLRVNGRQHELALDPNVSLLQALRDLGYTDVKNGCEIGECGACAVLLNGAAVNSCMVLVWQTNGAEIVTNAGLGTLGKPHPIQEAFADVGAVQCGYCTPGMVISTKALLDRNPNPSEAEIREALSGNLCRCTGYGQIVEAVQAAARSLRQADEASRRGERTAGPLRSPSGPGAAAGAVAVSRPLTGENVAPPPAALTGEAAPRDQLLRRGGERR
jgi:carbon-monoxide dehydrogenase small subunit